MAEIGWIMEYIKVLAAYGLLLFVWPSVVFRKYLSGKTLSFRFSFCATAQLLIINTAVLLLGLLHCLNAWAVNFLFWGIPLLSLAGSARGEKKERHTLRRLLAGTYGKRLFLRNLLSAVRRKGKECREVICRQAASRWAEYIVLGMALLYGMVYFSYGAFQDHTYGFSDLYTHHEWIYRMTQGNIFADGVYPAAMHCFVYLLHTVFGIRIYSCMLYLQGIHVAVLLLSAYLLAKEVFRWRFTPVFVLAAFLLLAVFSPGQIYGMARLQCTLPQEFGLHTLFLCAAFLIRYLYSSGQAVWRGKRTRGYWDENLLLFGMALAASLTIHFYPAIMAFFVCAGFALVSLKRVFCRRRLLPLIVTAVLGFCAAVLPMAGALAEGIPFQVSMDWAMSVIKGTQEADAPDGVGSAGTEEAYGSRASAGEADGAYGSVGEPAYGAGEAAGTDGAYGSGESAAEAVRQLSLTQKAGNALRGTAASLKQRVQVLADAGYTGLFGERRAGWILNCTAAAMLIGLGGSVLSAVRARIGKKMAWAKYNLYLGAAVVSVEFAALGCMPELGLPELVEHSRLGAVTQLLLFFVMAVPVDLLCSLLRMAAGERVVKGLSVCGVAGIYIGANLSGAYHGYLYYELSRYDEKAMVTEAIIDTLPENSYTVVSTVDDLYMLIPYGRHEELIDFINGSVTEDYRLPTEYVFLFVEKRPLEEYQLHFFTGPAWLAGNDYADVFGEEASRCPAVFASQISREAADTPASFYENNSRLYALLDVRTELMSKAYAWCEEFARLYPHELKTYYENENFVCYYFRQNPYSVYDLAIMGKGGDG